MLYKLFRSVNQFYIIICYLAKKGDKMRKMILIIFALLFLQGNIFSQSILFSKDSLRIEGEGFYDDIKDSLFIKNIGDNELVIDSIYTKKIYAYPVDVISTDTSYQLFIIFDQEQSPIIISPQDSIKLIFYMPDLCPICNGSSTTNFEDTLYVRNNSIDDSNHLLFISGQGLTDVKENNVIQNEYSLEQNYPNPFNPSTNIVYSLKNSSYITIEIFDVLGRSIEKLFQGFMDAGKHEILFDGTKYSSGTYYYQLRVGENIYTKKMLLIK